MAPPNKNNCRTRVLDTLFPQLTGAHLQPRTSVGSRKGTSGRGRDRKLMIVVPLTPIGFCLGGPHLPSPACPHPSLVAPYRVMLRYYRCDTLCRAMLFQVGWHSPQNGAIPPRYLVSQRHTCAIPHFATHCSIIVRCPKNQAQNRFAFHIATSITRYEKYRY